MANDFEHAIILIKMEVSIDNQTRFVCVEYPGFVKDDKKMLNTLGGESQISEVITRDITIVEQSLARTKFH